MELARILADLSIQQQFIISYEGFFIIPFPVREISIETFKEQVDFGDFYCHNYPKILSLKKLLLYLATIFFNGLEWTKGSFFYVRDLNLAQNDTYNPLIRSKTCSIDRKSNGEFVGKNLDQKVGLRTKLEQLS